MLSPKRVVAPGVAVSQALAGAPEEKMMKHQGLLTAVAHQWGLARCEAVVHEQVDGTQCADWPPCWPALNMKARQKLVREQYNM